ncbi:B2 protein-like isoform X2 [Lycium barbarum]|uniref:B2 protein-like isoform X2 n=1 Tax=Lycium barbarum TaxID=112863 RepID=UPI00293E814F|nr:B2 protein-like isoform X2 [Lycium barbarum]XP_060180137.1 B2 protein-like isoform X2 [Lycium barbarum]
MENNQSFYQFSDNLRLQTNNLANLSSNDSIWSNNYISKKPEERRNFDIRVGGEINSVNPIKNYNLFSNDGFKIADVAVNGGGGGGGVSLNGGFNKGVYTNPLNFNNIMVNSSKGFNIKKNDDYGFVNKFGKKNNNKINRESNKDLGGNNSTENNKKYKTLPASESLPRNETVGGYIFVCNNDTMHENLKRELFGLPPRYRDSVRQITPGLPLFLYNYSTHQLHGIFEAASFGGSNIDPTAWEDKKNNGESRFPAQVRVVTRKICEPLEEDSFRPILHHYDGPKFRLELSIPEALSLLDIFADKNILNSLLN